MTYSKLVDRIVPTPNQDVRAGGAKPKYIVHHHEAGTSFEAVIESWRTGRKEGSCHITISNEGEKVGIVPEEKRAWSLSSQFFDSQALTTEIENQSAGGSWPVSDAAQEAAAQVTADWCKRYGIPCDREHVIGHREVYTRFGDSYATACPGGLDLDWIVTRARAILAAPTGGKGGGTSVGGSIPAHVAPKPAPKPAKPSAGEYRYTSTEEDGDPGEIYYGRIQTLGKERGVYPQGDDIDGETGPDTEIARVKITAQALNGWVYGPHTTSDKDGDPGVNYWTAVQEVGRAKFGYPSWCKIDGEPGPETRKAEHKICAHELNTHR